MGLGGLSAATCLMLAGHDVEIYEQAPALAEVGAGIQISANAFHVMRHLGLEAKLLATGSGDRSRIRLARATKCAVSPVAI